MRAFACVAGAAALATLCLAVPGARDTSGPPVGPAMAPVIAPVALSARQVASSAASDLLGLVNVARKSAGCGPVRLDAHLSAAAAEHSADMAERDYFSHAGRNGDTFVDRAEAAGYATPRSENIAAGGTTAQATMRQWMNSAEHRHNILDCSAKDMGVGVGSDPGSTYGTYWTQDFGRG